eukprot:3510138-Alexandrium_andersonii.AAC.1
MAAKKLEASPFPPELLGDVRGLIGSFVAQARGARPSLEIVPNQPFFLHLAAGFAHAVGDPDARVLTEGKHCYAR